MIGLYDAECLARSRLPLIDCPFGKKQSPRSLAGGMRLICDRRRRTRSARSVALRITMGNVIHIPREDVPGTIFASPCADEIVAPVDDITARPTGNTACADRLSPQPGFEGYPSMSIVVQEQACHRSDMRLSTPGAHLQLSDSNIDMHAARKFGQQPGEREGERGEESLSSFAALRALVQEDLHHDCTSVEGSSLRRVGPLSKLIHQWLCVSAA